MDEKFIEVTAGAELLKAAQNEPGDEFGRALVVVENPEPKESDLLVLSRWQSERWRSFGERLSTERIAFALRAAEEGDLGAQMALFGEMEERDPALASVMQTRRFYPLGLDRTMLPAKLKNATKAERERAQKIADECEEMIEQIPEFDSWLLDMFDAIGKGFSVTEKVYNADATILFLKYIEPTMLSFEPPDGSLHVTVTGFDFETKKIRVADYPWKFIIHRAKMRSGHPARGGIFRVLVWVYVFRNYGLRDWSIFCERFGMPMRLGKYGPGATPNDKAVLTDMVEQMGSEAWAVISEKTQIEFKELMARGVEPFSALYRAMANEYALAVVGQTATNLVNEYGTRGDSDVKQLVRQDIGEADCKFAEATLKRDLLYPFVLARYGEETARRMTPTLHFNYEPPVDLKALTDVDKFAIKEMGLSKYIRADRFAERYMMRDLLTLPDDADYDPDLMLTSEDDAIDEDEEGAEEEQRKPGEKKPKPDEGADDDEDDEKAIEFVSIPTIEGTPIRVAKGDLVRTENRGLVREYELRDDDVIRLQRTKGA
jgi:phage gp29-like protein